MNSKSYKYQKDGTLYEFVLSDSPDDGGARLTLIAAPYLSCMVDLGSALKDVRIVYLDEYKINGHTLNPLELREDEIQHAVLLLEQAFKDFHFAYSPKAVHYQAISKSEGVVLYTRYGRPIIDNKPRMYRGRSYA